jgi:FixJ family two-component response regulator
MRLSPLVNGTKWRSSPNKQVAVELSISEVTVNMHRNSVMRKLGAKSVAMLARMAEALGIER